MLGFGRTEDFQRYHLIRAMNMLMNSAEVEPLIGEMWICPVRPVNSTYIKIDSGSGPGGLARAHGAERNGERNQTGARNTNDVTAHRTGAGNTRSTNAA